MGRTGAMASVVDSLLYQFSGTFAGNVRSLPTFAANGDFVQRDGNFDFYHCFCADCDFVFNCIGEW